MMSNSALNSKVACFERTFTNSSVMMSGARRTKDAPGFLDIEEHTTDLGNYEHLTANRGVIAQIATILRRELRVNAEARPDHYLSFSVAICPRKAPERRCRRTGYTRSLPCL